MDDQRRTRPDDKRPGDASEGVRIIGADEAAEAIERGEVAARRGDDELRFGDRPASPPAGPRPALRFPLDASADPTRIERPPVQPAPDPVTGPVTGSGAGCTGGRSIRVGSALASSGKRSAGRGPAGGGGGRSP
jgi:hypothetical protein